MKRILIVESNALVREGIIRLFREEKGIVFVEADSVEEGVSRLRGGDYDLIISEWYFGWNSPSGEEIVTNAQARKVPILVLAVLTSVVTVASSDTVRILGKDVHYSRVISEVKSLLK